jgi:uncharacterized membrane protein
MSGSGGHAPVERTTAMARGPVWRTLLRTSVIVLAAGFVAGTAAGMAPFGRADAPGIVDTLGKAFVDQRVVTLFILALPAIGVCERFGLQDQARAVVRRIRAATVGRLMTLYHLFRIGVVALGIRLGSGHVTFARPLVIPMALGAAGLDVDAEETEAEVVKGLAGASENYANFFGQNLYFGSAGVFIIADNLGKNGHSVYAADVAAFTMIMAGTSFVVAVAEYVAIDSWLRRRAARGAGG